jgi:hypothetical protein
MAESVENSCCWVDLRHYDGCAGAGHAMCSIPKIEVAFENQVIFLIYS